MISSFSSVSDNGAYRCRYQFEIESLLHAFRSESRTLGVARPVPSRHRTCLLNPVVIDRSERLSAACS